MNLRTYLIHWGRYEGLEAVACARCWDAVLASEGAPPCSGQHRGSIVSPERNTSLIAVLKGEPTPMATIGTEFEQIGQRWGMAI
jgi:hypothetical protein